MSNKYGIFEMKNAACEKNVFQGMAPTLKGCKLAQRMFHLKRHFFEEGMFSSIRYISSGKMHVLQGHATVLEGRLVYLK